MFPNSISGFIPVNAPLFGLPLSPDVANAPTQAALCLPPANIGEIYQAARQRALEDHELDKLFNAEYYGDGI